jgi:moderate conductance mechanosensitive channel
VCGLFGQARVKSSVQLLLRLSDIRRNVISSQFHFRTGKFMSRYFTLAFWQDFWQEAVRTAAARGLRLVAIVLLYMLARLLVNRVIDAGLARLMARQAAKGGGEDRIPRLRTLQGLVKSVAGYFLFFLLLVMVLQALTVDVTGIITSAGVMGLAIGFGAQKLVKDVISGFFLIVEDQFAVDDFVTIGAATGTVEEIGTRITRLRDESGRLWILSNGDITIVTNHSRAPVESFVEISVAPAVDVKEAERILNEAGEELKNNPDSALLRVPRSLGVAAYDATKTVIRVEIVTEPRHLTAVQLRAREFMRGKLVSAGIVIA